MAVKYNRGYWKGVTPDGRKFKVAKREEAEELAGLAVQKGPSDDEESVDQDVVRGRTLDESTSGTDDDEPKEDH